jgi:hypothetical protein
MTHPGLATHVGVVQGDPQVVDGIVVRQLGPINLMGSTPIDRLFDDAREAEKESGLLAEPLAEVSRQVAAQETAVRANAADPATADMTPSLTIAEDVSRTLLKRLRRGGAALRARLTPQCVAAFQARDFLAGSRDEPPLTFEEQDSIPHILWDLMYEGGTVGDVSWESFWGFRVPIAHWVLADRTKRVALRRSMFGAIHQDLPFAAREIDAIAERLNRVGPCLSVVDYFRRFVRERLIAASLSEAEADAWLAANADEWLEEYLYSGAGKPDDADQWKQDKIVEMLKSTDNDVDLLHFACHSEPSTGVASRAELKMKVGGAELTFDVGSMKANLRRQITSVSDPGPLVFLNACRSVEGIQPFQPPPFATSWINDRAALAVISAVCPVPDYFAHAFALKYYDFLFGTAEATFGGRPVKGSLAGALLATRRYFMDVHRNPLGLGYVLYASPGAYVALGGR